MVVDYKLEVVRVPVSDVDRARDFYQGLGWRLDGDHSEGGRRIVQFTPPGSACSIQLGSTGTSSAAPGSAQGLELVVDDIDSARADLNQHGAQVSEVFHQDNGKRAPGPDPQHRSYQSLASFTDPDGNGWLLQEITTRLPGRETSALAAFDSVQGLASALRRAAAAHDKHEQQLGHPDADWSDWYAQYLVNESAGKKSSS